MNTFIHMYIYMYIYIYRVNPHISVTTNMKNIQKTMKINENGLCRNRPPGPVPQRGGSVFIQGLAQTFSTPAASTFLRHILGQA